MRDITSISRLQLLHPAVRDKFKKFIETAEDTLNITLRIVQGLRTFEEQDAIYQQGRTKPGKIVSNARAGSSYHNYGLAIDVAQLVNGQINWNYDYSHLQQIARDFGIIWGADWDNDGKTKAQGDTDEHLVDMPHFQITFGYQWRTLLIIYNSKGFIPGTKYLNLPNAA